MFDIKLIRDDPDSVKTSLKAKGLDVDLSFVLKHDQKRRDLLAKLENLRCQKNSTNDEISKLLKDKKDPKAKISSMKAISSKINTLEPKVKKIQSLINDTLIGIPNLAHGSVPVGGVDKNEIVRSWGEPKTFDFKPKTHI